MLERAKQRVVGIGRRLGARYPFLKTAWHVQQRFGEVNGGYLASAITLASFLSLFPLLLVGIAVIGFVAGGDPSLGRDAAKFLGLTGDARELVVDTVEQAEASKAAASIVGVAGLLWTGLGLVAALQYALDQVWQVTGRGIKDKLVGLAWLVGGALLFVSSLAVTSVVSALPGFFAPLNIAVGLGLSFALFLWTMRVLPHHQVPWK
ncbi:MAG TPA: YhjD/YihY/BrkB family envelope integrity protein, partial [Acidimicrobiales bacterium]|nr:YhjD/YihY/BrkB family envelope integrity protein [Acidimicrobiales bacterium]